METAITKRDNYIDFLRFIGITMIILVHVTPPQIISQLRAFDVCLMVFVSGLVTNSNEKKSFWKYVVHRTKRLVFPIWIFLAFYIAFLCITRIDKSLTLAIILDSFLLRKGIGYIWIFRVFLLMMIITPCASWVVNKIKLDYMFILLLALILCLEYVGIQIYYNSDSIVLKENINYYVLDLIGYSTALLLGIRLKEAKNNLFWIGASIIVLIVGIGLFIYQYGLPILISPQYKYPPYGYYLVYGLVASALLFYSKPYISKIADVKLFTFVGRNTCWIYLWHIPLLSLLGYFISHWLVLFVAVYFTAITLYAVQRKIVSTYLIRFSFSKYLS